MSLKDILERIKEDIDLSLINRTDLTKKSQNLHQRIIYRKISDEVGYASSMYSYFRDPNEETLEECKQSLSCLSSERNKTFETKFNEQIEPICKIVTQVAKKPSLENKTSQEKPIRATVPSNNNMAPLLMVIALVIAILFYLKLKYIN